MRDKSTLAKFRSHTKWKKGKIYNGIQYVIKNLSRHSSKQNNLCPTHHGQWCYLNGSKTSLIFCVRNSTSHLIILFLKNTPFLILFRIHRKQQKTAYTLLNLLINKFNISILNISIKYITIRNKYYLPVKINNFTILMIYSISRYIEPRREKLFHACGIRKRRRKNRKAD